MSRSASDLRGRPGDAPISAEDLLAMGDIGPCELIEGRIVRMAAAGRRHGRVSLNIGAIIREHVRKHDQGEVSGTETGFIIRRNPDTVRAPDVAFVAKARLPDDSTDAGFWPIAPDLAVEVVSPSDTWTDVVIKAHAWLGAGVQLVWVVDPEARTTHVFSPGHPVIELSGADEVSGENVLPGFRVRVAEFFD